MIREDSRIRVSRYFTGSLTDAYSVALQLHPAHRMLGTAGHSTATTGGGGEEESWSPAPDELVRVLDCNCVSADFAQPDHPLRVLLLLGSMLNHSCLPSTTWRSSWDGSARCPVYRVYTTRPLAAGEELTVSYLTDAQLNMHPSRRKAELWRRYEFECACSRCVQPYDDTSVFLCKHCGGEVYAETTACHR